MISSMTGFGKGTSQFNSTIVEAEVKSVNSRFLEISLKLPKNFQNKEYELREFIRTKIKRGKLTLNIQLKKDGIEDNEIQLNEENLKAALTFLKDLKKKSKIKDEITKRYTAPS